MPDIDLRNDLSLMIIGPAAYRPFDATHSTFAIWRELSTGFSQLLVCARSARSPARWRDGNISVHLIRGFRPREVEFLLTQLLVIRRALRFRPDVILAQSPSLGGIAALLIGRILHAGTLIEVHGSEILGRAPALSRRWFLQLLSGPVLRRATVIRVLSEGMRGALIQRYGNAITKRLRVLPPRVDLRLFTPAIRPVPRGRLTLIMVGAINENKGQLRLATLLLRRDLPVTLHVAGRGPLEDACRRLAGQTENSQNFKMIVHGHLRQGDLVPLLEQSDLFIMYSRTEGTPRAMMEAMATGLPVITTNAGFCSEVARDGLEGWVVNGNEESAIVHALERILVDPSSLSKLGAAARQRAEQEFDAAKLFPLYRGLIREAALAWPSESH